MMRQRFSMLAAIMAFSRMPDELRASVGGFSGFCADKLIRASKGQAKYSGKGQGNRPTSFECNEGSDFDHNGKRERARRMRQIERGILKLA